jgi:hypothetical protein
MRKFILLAVCSWLFATGSIACAQSNLYEPGPAISQAEEFLNLLADFHFDKVWQSTTPLFRALHDKTAWEHEQRTLRLAYGPNLERHLKRIDFRTSYFHAPDGNYAIIQFDSNFKNKMRTKETVVLEKVRTGNWQIVDIILN